MIVPTLLVLASCLAAAAGLWGVLLALVRPQATGDVARLGLVSLALGPIALAWVLAQVMRLAPGAEPAVLAVLVPAVTLLPAVFFRRRLAAAAAALWRAGLDRRRGYALALVVLLAGLAALFIAGLPLVENDALEYATAARLIYESRSIALYPFVDSQASGGFYGPWTHPAGYPSLMVWSNIVQGGAAEPGLIRFPSWYAACATMLLLVGLAGGLGGALAALVLASTPIYFLAAIGTFVDPVRVGAAFATLVLIEQAARFGLDARRSLACGAGVGLSFFVHSIGITLFPMAFALMLLYGPARLRERIAGIALALVIAVALVLPDLASNLRSFGAIVADAPAVWSVPEVRYQEFMRVTRGIATFKDQVMNGVLQGLFGTIYYGFSYWLLLLLALGCAIAAWRGGGLSSIAGLARLHEAPHERRWLLLSAAFVFAWGAMAFGALLAGSVEFVKNLRYGLTVQPFVALFCGLALAVAWKAPSRAAGGIAAGAAALACAGSLALIGIYVAFQFVLYPIAPGWFSLSDREMLAGSRLPTVHVTRKIDQLLEGGGCALLFRQADYAWNGKGCYRSYLDHRLIDLYRTDSAEGALSVLREHGIRIVAVPRYGLPEYTDTAVGALLADPRRAQLVWSWDGERIFRLGEPPARAERVSIARLGENLHFRDTNGWRSSRIRAGDFRDPEARLVSGDGHPSVAPGFGGEWSESFTCRQPVASPALHVLSGTLSGKGHVAIELVAARATSRESQKSASPMPLWEGVLNGRRALAVQYVVEPGQCAAQRLRVTLLTPGEVAIEGLDIARVEGAAPGAQTYAAAVAEAAGWSSFSRRYYSKGWEWGWSVQRGAMVQRVPAALARPEVALAAPPVNLGLRPSPRRIRVEVGMEGTSRAKVFLERLTHVGTLGVCRGDGDPLRLAAQLMQVYRAQLTAYPAEHADTQGLVFQVDGAAATCYRPAARTVLEAAGSDAGSGVFEIAHDGFEAFRIVFLHPRAPAETELAVRRLRVTAIGADGVERTLQDFQPRPGELPAIR